MNNRQINQFTKYIKKQNIIQVELITKTCKICEIAKPLYEFYFTSNRKYLSPYCKSCSKEYSRKQKLSESGKKYSREYFSRPENIIKRRESEAKTVRKEKRAKDWQEKYKGKYNDNYNEWAKLYPEKVLAHSAVLKVKVAKGLNKHHWSYLEEHRADIIILTYSRHMIAHKHMIYDQREMMFRTIDGILLNTKELHLEYINSLL